MRRHSSSVDWCPRRCRYSAYTSHTLLGVTLIYPRTGPRKVDQGPAHLYDPKAETCSPRREYTELNQTSVKRVGFNFIGFYNSRPGGSGGPCGGTRAPSTGSCAYIRRTHPILSGIVSGFGSRVSGFELRVPGFRLQASDFGLQASGSGFHV